MEKFYKSDTAVKCAIAGNALHAPSCGEIEFLDDVLIVVDGTGFIQSIVTPTDSHYEQLKNELEEDDKLHQLSNKEYLLPGLIDLHIHAPQWPQMGKALHLPLYDWLHTCTFPLEAKYADVAFAEVVYRSLVNRSEERRVGKESRCRWPAGH